MAEDGGKREIRSGRRDGVRRDEAEREDWKWTEDGGRVESREIYKNRGNGTKKICQ